jgi:hypothetical protein
MALTLLVPIALAGCSAGSVTSVASTGALKKLDDSGAQLGESSARSGDLLVTKICDKYHGLPGQQCTITQSSLAAIAGSTITYASGADANGHLDTNIVIDPPGPGESVVFGHCALSLVTAIGACELNGGTGKFSKLHAQVAVAVAPAGLPYFTWTGTYSYGK